jgi:cytidylate kinase
VIVAIDGPAGAGKSSLSAMLARELGFSLIDTGAMYRSVALQALKAGVDLRDGDALGAIASALDIDFHFEGGRNHVYLGGVDVSEAIRTAEVSREASRVSAFREVREALVDAQRRLGARGDVVMEGRDIGTHVFPTADVKLFLTASVDERARRRVAELRAKGAEAALDDVRREIEERDHRDSTREVAPLRQAADAVLVDTTGMTQDAVLAAMLDVVRHRRAVPSTS